MLYEFKVKYKNGDTVSGIIEGEDWNDASDYFHNRYMKDISLLEEWFFGIKER